MTNWPPFSAGADRFRPGAGAKLPTWKQLRRVCDWIEAPIDYEIEARMRRFLSDNAQHKHGRHSYQLSDFGLSEDQVRERFATYRSRYGFS